MNAMTKAQFATPKYRLTYLYLLSEQDVSRISVLTDFFFLNNKDSFHAEASTSAEESLN